jgi:hypothetical protein
MLILEFEEQIHEAICLNVTLLSLTPHWRELGKN